MVVGPHGIVVLARLPDPETTRQIEGHWEGRIDDDHWVAIEDPYDRTARDAEAVRRWLVADEHGFVVKVYAVMVAEVDPAARNPNVGDRPARPGPGLPRLAAAPPDVQPGPSSPGARPNPGLAGLIDQGW